MTVLHVDTGREMRGGQWQVMRLLRGLRKRGHKVMLAARKQGPLIEMCRNENFACDVAGWDSLLWVSAKADIVHAHDARAHTLASLFSRKPFVAARRVIFPVQRNPFSMWKYSRPRMYAAVSQAVAVQLRAAGVPDRKIRVIYDGVPLLPEGWKFHGTVIAPKFNDMRKGLAIPSIAADKAGVPLHWSTRLESDLRGASMMVYLTSSEGLGSAAILAMSAGIPVIASDLGGLREVVRHGETGFLVPNEVRKVADAIRVLQGQLEIGERMSRRAREVARDVFGEDRMVEETLAMYQSVLDG